MAPAHILSFPLEIKQLIGNLLPRDQRALRLVCSQFNLALEASVRSTLVIYITRTSLKQSICLLETLASQKSQAAQFARTLKIKYLLPSFQQPEPASTNQSKRKPRVSRKRDALEAARATATMKRRLGPAISSLHNLKSVVWTVNDKEPTWTQNIVMDALTGLSHLQDFKLVISSYSSNSHFQLQLLERLSGLKKISVEGFPNLDHSMIGGIQEAVAKSPELVHLEYIASTYNDTTTVTLHDLLSKVPQGSPLRLTHLVLHGMGVFACNDSLTIPHLRSLTYSNLDLSPADDDDQTRESIETYGRLNREKIHIKQVVLNGLLDDVILDYLDSYSGLETLGLSDSLYSESNALSRRFFKSVLPKHIDSIQVLKIQPQYEGGWCYDSDADDVSPGLVFAQCKKLRSLSVSLTSNKHTNFDKTISSLINLSFTLPYLTQISISLADVEIHGFFTCGYSRMNHLRFVDDLITRSVKNFRLRDREHYSGKILPDILLRSGFYHYQTLGRKRWGYKSAKPSRVIAEVESDLDFY